MLKKLRTRSWYPYAVALCIAVVLYVVLVHLPAVAGGLKTFGRYFNTVVIGCIVAYLMNPLAKLYERKLFRNLKKGSWAISVILAFVTFIAAIVALAFTLIAIVVMGNAFGIGGILLAIPVAAICDFTYREGVLPHLQRRKAEKQAARDAEAKQQE